MKEPRIESNSLEKLRFVPPREPEQAPNFDESQVKARIACIRPYREKTFRLDEERVADKIVVNNYGHGGAGITVSWGCALEASRLVHRHLNPNADIAVLGAGIIGLSTAYVLVKAGYRVVVYSKDFPPDTTSDKAGGQWSPSMIAVGESEAEQERFARILSDSFREFSKRIGETYGVFCRPNYVEAEADTSFLKIPKNILPEATLLDELPFKGVKRSGRVHMTLLVEPPIYMPRLVADVEELGGKLKRATFEKKAEVASLSEKVIVNCLGLGAGEFMDDSLVVPIRGQLVMLKPQRLPWMLSHSGGYIFPRNDGVVLGGTVERGVAVGEPDEQACQGILNRNRRFFELDQK